MNTPKEKNELLPGFTPAKLGDFKESELASLNRNKAKPEFLVRCLNCSDAGGKEVRNVHMFLCQKKGLLKRMKFRIDEPKWEKILDAYCTHEKLNVNKLESNPNKLSY